MSFYTGDYKIIADGQRAGAESSYVAALQHANRYAHNNPEAISVTVDLNGHTVYNATPERYGPQT
jgi:hypothetical protein